GRIVIRGSIRSTSAAKKAALGANNFTIFFSEGVEVAVPKENHRKIRGTKSLENDRQSESCPKMGNQKKST
ncbi:MAG: hypothetical protein N2578_06250, partial [Bdellovibrionaceae bacterium]|nr:hypothetical protein [Pseudobdellovibrionaceae bacterium]